MIRVFPLACMVCQDTRLFLKEFGLMESNPQREQTGQ